jgi:hypothetical protein
MAIVMPAVDITLDGIASQPAQNGTTDHAPGAVHDLAADQSPSDCTDDSAGRMAVAAAGIGIGGSQTCDREQRGYRDVNCECLEHVSSSRIRDVSERIVLPTATGDEAIGSLDGLLGDTKGKPADLSIDGPALNSLIAYRKCQ